MIASRDGTGQSFHQPATDPGAVPRHRRVASAARAKSQAPPTSRGARARLSACRTATTKPPAISVDSGSGGQGRACRQLFPARLFFLLGHAIGDVQEQGTNGRGDEAQQRQAIQAASETAGSVLHESDPPGSEEATE